MNNEDVFVVLFEGRPGPAVRLPSEQILKMSRDLRSAGQFFRLLLGAPKVNMTCAGKKPGDAPMRALVMRPENFAPGQQFEAV